MKYGIGLCGSHRTGKTTLAQAVSTELGIPFCQTRVSKVFSDLGYIPSVDYPLETRMLIQDAILTDCLEVWSHCDTQFITDRAPIDLMAYTIGSIRQEEITPELDKVIQNYLIKCVTATNMYFSDIIEIRPVIPIQPETGKANIMKSHIDHIAYLVSGIIASGQFSKDTSISTLPLRLTNIDDRVFFVTSMLNWQ